jgi:REP element-mobilizing transposase RayT
MARLARIVIPGLPHHVTQRGNRRKAIFFEDGDDENLLGRKIARRAPGRKPATEADVAEQLELL